MLHISALRRPRYLAILIAAMLILVLSVAYTYEMRRRVASTEVLHHLASSGPFGSSPFTTGCAVKVMDPRSGQPFEFTSIALPALAPSSIVIAKAPLSRNAWPLRAFGLKGSGGAVHFADGHTQWLSEADYLQATSHWSK